MPPTATATRTYTPSKTPTRTVPITTTTITLPPTVTATRTYTPYRTPTRTPTSTISSSTTTTTVFSCPSSGELACRLGTANWCCADRKACGLTAGSCISTPCGATLQACNPPNSTISLCCPIGQVCGSTTSCTCPGPNCNILNTTLGIRQHWCCNAGEICSNTTYGTCAFLNCPTNQVSCGGACCDTSDQNSNGRPDHICVYDNVQKKGVCKGEGNACPDPVAGGGSVFCKYYNNQALCCNPDEVCDPNPNTPKRCYPSGTFPCKGTGLPDGIGCPNGYICEPRIYKPPTFTSPCMEPSYTYCGKNASNGPVMCPLGKTCIPGPPALCGGTP